MSEVAAEARALADAAGIVCRDDMATLRVTGADRVDYLHRMLTQDILLLAPGHARPACLLDIRGRILGNLLIWNVEDAVLIELPRRAIGSVAPVLEKYVIQDDVMVGEARERATRFDLIGAGAGAALASLGLEAPEPGVHVFAKVSGRRLRLLRHDLGARLRYVLRVENGDIDEVSRAVQGSGCVRSCSAAAFDVARIEEAIPAFGVELSDAVLFNEAGLADHVSFSKGCYPGQEPVLMAKHRGRPPRRLCALTVEAAAPPPSGTELSVGGKAVGVVTSAANGVVRPGIRALAFVQSAAAEEGAALTVGSLGTAWIDRVRVL